VVRSGLLGGADANGDGQVSYLELAAFVDTATIEVRNPNMRPHVFARGPGALDTTPIANLQTMSGVRRFELSDASPLRVRLRDRNGLPLLDVNAESARQLVLSVPEGWTRGSVLERAGSQFGVPEPPGTVTLALLEPVATSSAGRGPGAAFEPLFVRPFGPLALADYQKQQSSLPAPVFGVSREDALRMQLLLDQLGSVARGKRVSESVGGIGFGTLLGGAGIGILHVDADATQAEKTEARILGGVMLGLGGVFVIGGAGALLTTSESEQATLEFRRSIRAGQDPTQAFARADDMVRKLIEKRRGERLAQGVIGTLVIVGCATGLTVGEIAAHGGGNRMGRRLGWGGGIVGGTMMLADAIWMEQPADALARIWREDPSLNQYQTPLETRVIPGLRISRDGAMLSLTGAL
jgi:hypothetical protein